MRVYSEKDANVMSWAEFGTIVDRLVREIRFFFENKGTKVNYVAPVLRSGAFLGSAVAIQLRTTRILPLQFKYHYEQDKTKPILLWQPHVVSDKIRAPHILICENNTSTGETAYAAIATLKEHFPDCKLYYATVTRVFGAPDSFDGFEHSFFGIRTNERFKATKEQINELNLRHGITIFPWENTEDELKEMNYRP